MGLRRGSKPVERLQVLALPLKSKLQAPGPWARTTTQPVRTTRDHRMGITIGPGHSSVTRLLQQATSMANEPISAPILAQ